MKVVINESNKEQSIKEIEMMTSSYQKFANECGYKIASPFWKRNRFCLRFIPMSDFSPDIDVETCDDGSVTFKIHTISYGALDIDHYEKFMKANAEAFRLTHYFNDMSAYELSDKFPTVEFEK